MNTYTTTLKPRTIDPHSTQAMWSFQDERLFGFRADGMRGRAITATVPTKEIQRFETGTFAVWTGQLRQQCVVPELVQFRAYRDAWYRERGATSSITAMAMCPSYQRIIAMGPRVIPLILRQIEDEGDEPDMWFWALQALTGVDPVPPADRGDMTQMMRAWLDWAYLQGYDW